MVMKACSTLVAFLADVSKNGMPSWSAYSCKRQIRHSLEQTNLKYLKNCFAPIDYLGYIEFNHFLVSKITFVAYKEFVYIITSIAVNFFKPLFDIVK